MKTQMIDKSTFDERQHKADTDTAYECGRASVMSVIEDIKAEIEKSSFEHYMEFGEYIGEDRRKEKIVYLDRVLEIIDKHISRKEQ